MDNRVEAEPKTALAKYYRPMWVYGNAWKSLPDPFPSITMYSIGSCGLPLRRKWKVIYYAIANFLLQLQKCVHNPFLNLMVIAIAI